MKYIMAYYYDVPHSTNFVVAAKNKKEALREARRLLREGKFDGIEGDPDDTGYRERVYIGRTVSKAEESHWPKL